MPCLAVAAAVGLVKRAIFGENLERLYGQVRHAEHATEDGYTAIKRR